MTFADGRYMVLDKNEDRTGSLTGANGAAAGGACEATSAAARPIGIFDSGVGGMTVALEIMRQLPNESLVYFGDTLRCPYGPRALSEISEFAVQISIWLARQNVKLIVIACNTATAAALDLIRQISPVPVIGVIEPGARAAVAATVNRNVGVIGTTATIESGAYSTTIRQIDPKITVFSTPTPRFVEIVEAGLRLDRNPLEDFIAPVSSIYIRPAFQEIARDYLDSLRRSGIDTLVLGCTHYPLIAPLISSCIGPDVRIISSAEETAHDVARELSRLGQLARGDFEAAPADAESGLADSRQPSPAVVAARHRFVTTGSDLDDFRTISSAILGLPIASVEQVSLAELESCQVPAGASPVAASGGANPVTASGDSPSEVSK